MTKSQKKKKLIIATESLVTHYHSNNERDVENANDQIANCHSIHRIAVVNISISTILRKIKNIHTISRCKGDLEPQQGHR